jgi:hypothetical protein
MKTPFKRSLLDLEIDRVIEKMSKIPPDSEDYLKAATSLKTLCDAKAIKAKASVSPDTWVLVGANLLGIVAILNFERTGIVVSKAVNFVLKKGA